MLALCKIKVEGVALDLFDVGYPTMTLGLNFDYNAGTN